MKKKTSLKDIAQKVGVSTALVSYVLNNQREGRISKEVAGRIRAVARELNYSPNQVARSLRTSKTSTIGLIVADISNPFFSNLARIIEDEAAKNNFTVIFGSSDECADKSLKLLQVLLNRQVDGLIIAAAANSEAQLRYLQEHDIPFVLIDRYFPDLPTHYVTIDNHRAAQQAVQHLLGNGYRRIGLITFASPLQHLQERKQGYNTALQLDAQTGPEEQWIKELSINHTAADVERAVNELLSLPEAVDAILFASNTLSTLGLKYINTLPIKVPRELAIISFDESDASYLFYAPLTHIRQPLKEIGQHALQILISNIEEKTPPRQLKLKAELVPGKSTLPPAVV